MLRGADIIACKVGHDLQVRFPFQFFGAWNLSSASSSTCAIIYHLARDPDVHGKLQAYLDEHLGSENRPVATADQMKQLPYLDGCPLGVDVVMWTVGRTLVPAENMDYSSAQVDVETLSLEAGGEDTK